MARMTTVRAVVWRPKVVARRGPEPSPSSTAMLGFCQTGTAEGTLEPDESPKRKAGMLRVRIGWGIDGHFFKGSSYPRVDTATGVAMVVKLDGVSWEPTGEP